MAGGELAVSEGHLCQLCEGGRRHVGLRTIDGVELWICQWCWDRYGPAAHEHRFDVPQLDVVDFLDARARGEQP
jgi:hypothetical protein